MTFSQIMSVPLTFLPTMSQSIMISTFTGGRPRRHGSASSSGQPCTILASLHRNRPSQPSHPSQTPPIDRLPCGEACQKHAGYVAVDSLHFPWACDPRVERPRSSAGFTPSGRMPLLPLDPSMIVYLPGISRQVSSCTRVRQKWCFARAGTQGGFDGPAPDNDLPRTSDHTIESPQSQTLAPSHQQRGPDGRDLRLID